MLQLVLVEGVGAAGGSGAGGASGGRGAAAGSGAGGASGGRGAAGGQEASATPMGSGAPTLETNYESTSAARYVDGPAYRDGVCFGGSAEGSIAEVGSAEGRGRAGLFGLLSSMFVRPRLLLSSVYPSLARCGGGGSERRWIAFRGAAEDEEVVVGVAAELPEMESEGVGISADDGNVDLPVLESTYEEVHAPGDVPDYPALIAMYKCSLTQEVYKDPVTTCTGFTYSRDFIREWMRGSGRTSDEWRCPHTRQVLQPISSTLSTHTPFPPQGSSSELQALAELGYFGLVLGLLESGRCGGRCGCCGSHFAERSAKEPIEKVAES